LPSFLSISPAYNGLLSFPLFSFSKEMAVRKLQRQYRRLLARRYVELLRQNRVALEAAHLTAAAVKVQSRYRANKAKAAAAKFKEVREHEEKAASFVQSLWRRKISAWRITEQALEEVC